MTTILVQEDLIPPETDPWELFDQERWTQTDFERNVNLRRSIIRAVEQHIEALDEIDSASVQITMPEEELFTELQDPVTASVIIAPAPGSSIRESRSRIQGIERLVQFAVEGLTPENITITDTSGVILNDFEGLAELDRVELTRRELQIKQDTEEYLRQVILSGLQPIFGADRVQIPRVDTEIDMGRRTTESEEFSPIIVTPDDPQTPFSERETVLSITESQQTFSEEWEGTGFNPEGPPGAEGQTPPAYQDVDGIVGRYNRDEVTTNNVVNRSVTTEEGSPSVGRRTIGVAIDGRWEIVYNEQGQPEQNPDGSLVRNYIPVSEEDLQKAREVIQDAIGFDADRGDQVTVQHIQFNRAEEFEEEDEAFRRRRQIQLIVLYSLIGIAGLLGAFIVFRLVSREVERRRRLREEELARQHQAMREAALRSAEEESSEVEMSVEERARMEMQENAINMAREHPEDVAQLIRTWLMEE
jgi:flagellar M-ring protein FliF